MLQSGFICVNIFYIINAHAPKIVSFLAVVPETRKN